VKYLLADVRTMVAAWIVFVAIGKAMAPGLTAHRLGWSRALRAPVALAAVVAVSLAEAGGALACFAGVVHGRLPAAVIIGVGLAVTCVGFRNIEAVGSCGCGGARFEATSIGRLAGRNLLVFGALAVGVRFGPSISAFDDSRIALAVAVNVGIVAIGVAGLGGTRLVKARLSPD
jgi:hypothetical protein